MVTASVRCPNCDSPIHDCIDLSSLSLRHKLALSIFIQKFIKGTEEHGDISADKDWTKDILEEMRVPLPYTIPVIHL